MVKTYRIHTKTPHGGTVNPEIIENLPGTLELPLLVGSVSSEQNLLIAFCPPNPKPEILDVLAPFSTISVFTVT